MCGVIVGRGVNSGAHTILLCPVQEPLKLIITTEWRYWPYDSETKQEVSQSVGWSVGRVVEFSTSAHRFR